MTSRKNLSIFIRIVSFGSIFVAILMLSIIGVGIYGCTNTDYIVWTEKHEQIWESHTRGLYWARPEFNHLAGILCVGFFLHTVSMPILKSNKNQKNNIRDLTIGYLCVLLSYVICGVMGYIGFVGYAFRKKYEEIEAKTGE